MVRASGIPELRRFCHTITAGAQLLEAKHFLQSTLSSLLSSVELWASSSPPRPQVEDHGQDESVQIVLKDVKAEVRILPDWLLHRPNQRRFPKRLLSQELNLGILSEKCFLNI